MKRIFKVLFVGFLMALMFACGPTKKTTEEITFGASSIKSSYEMPITQLQLDSICEADTLPEYNRWIKATFTDYETNEVFVKRLYIKSYSKDSEIIYILIGEEEPYKITKRIGK